VIACVDARISVPFHPRWWNTTRLRRPSRWLLVALIGIVAGTILLVVVSVIVVFMLGRPRTAPPADTSTPAGVVQAYIEALRDNDVTRSRTYLTNQARAEAEARDKNNTYRPSPQDSVRIVVEQVSATDTRAQVKVTTSRFYANSDPFSSSSSHRDTTVALVREDGAWRITQALETYGNY
jgi:hypothetical protein